jgi:hypothetical protein
MKTKQIPITELSQDPSNVRRHSERNLAAITASLRKFGQQKPIVIDSKGIILAGNGTYEAAKRLGWDTLAVVQTDLKGSEAIAYAIADNRTAELAEWDDTALAETLRALQSEDFEIEAAGFTDDELDDLLEKLGSELAGHEENSGTGEGGTSNGNGSLADRFGIPPFSVLNAREGWWQDRKRSWLALGIKSEVGRGGEGLKTCGIDQTHMQKFNEKLKKQGQKQVFNPRTEDAPTGTSVFDPVLCELAYRWFCPDAGTILDPFAGGSVRGIVASHCNRQYVGVELRQEQVDANRAQQDIATDLQPVWHCGDSRTIDRICADVQADFLFSCPPYADLEVYSDNPSDLSTLSYSEFRPAYFEIIAKACTLLKDDRFACFVVGDIRDKKGNYYNFVGDTVEAFRAAGLHYYNEAILVTAVGNLPIRVGKQFTLGRKLGKTHQNVLVFVKGDGKKAAAACGECDFGDIGETEETGEADQ